MMQSDDFPRDPYGWVTNQCGHVLIGLALAALTPWAWGGDPVTIAALYWLVSEVALQRRSLFRDAVQDAGFVAAGAVIPPALAVYWQGAALVGLIGAALALGAWVRR